MAKRKRKLRSLVTLDSSVRKSSRSLELSIAISVFLTGVAFAIHYSNINTTMLWGDFLATYRNQYNQIVHGEKDYCLPIIDTPKLFAHISNQVLNQPLALSNIELALRNDSRFTTIAVVGTTGVGKSLFAQALKERFPWQENTQMYSWSDYQTATQKQEDVLTFFNYLSECGRNLIIIDNLRTEDVDFVRQYNRQAMSRVEEANVNLIIVFVFNMLTYTEEQRERYDDGIKMLNQLEDIELVKFRKFNSNDLDDCIRNEAMQLNVTLDDDGLKEVIKSIDVERSGCKNVYGKVLMYGDVS